MIIFPAIDLKDNKCVRLSQGDFNNITIYSNEPLEIAYKWESEGALHLHLVDLDGAKSEDIINKKCIENIVKNTNLYIQIGGGIRSKKEVEALINMGVDRVIVGTVAVEDKELLKDLIDRYKEKIVVSIDAKYGKVALKGWKLLSEVDSIELCKELEKLGIKTIVYTDISKDGMLQGPNFEIYKLLSEETSLNIIASGGISSIEDIKRLKEMNIYGAIIGKALYDNKLNLEEVIRCSQEE